MPLVLIEWVDAYGPEDEWIDIPKLKKPGKALLNKSVGWLAFDGPEIKRLVPNITDGEHVEARFTGTGCFVIPTKCVTRITKLATI